MTPLSSPFICHLFSRPSRAVPFFHELGKNINFLHYKNIYNVKNDRLPFVICKKYRTHREKASVWNGAKISALDRLIAIRCCNRIYQGERWKGMDSSRLRNILQKSAQIDATKRRCGKTLPRIPRVHSNQRESLLAGRWFES
jgi:hypothetical protein